MRWYIKYTPLYEPAEFIPKILVPRLHVTTIVGSSAIQVLKHSRLRIGVNHPGWALQFLCLHHRHQQKKFL
jgi:hypothetical protein